MLTTNKQNYQQIATDREKKRPLLQNCIRAFLVGGTICLIGQCISFFYMYFFDFTEETVGDPTTATLIFITMILTGLGIYDKIAQFAGAGSAVPVTGFGNAVISAAIEHRSEGFVQGVGGNMFKLAGSVILFGVFSAFIVALIKTALISLGVIG
ncbi:stage V sporulation protein AC [Amphibacillus sp. Q70]|uniref:stage V sporulation protein AC n=1 Tax=Amphibacillus sp. Q70 TaxID=3453416 RepID=UPI003F82BDF9